MTGIIISGHGNFATGLASSIKLIGGEFLDVAYIDFLDTDSTEQLRKKYIDAIAGLSGCENFLALADLVGGSPFKTLVELSTEMDKEMQVVGGTNLPMALEVIISRDTAKNLNELTAIAVEVGRESISKFELVKREQEAVDDGI